MKKLLTIAIVTMLMTSCNDAPGYRQIKQLFSVTDYGADPTGINDSYPAFIAAMKEAQEQGCQVVIPEGKYFFSSPIEALPGGDISASLKK